MASYYSIVQFLPDPLSDERINIGVIAFDDDEVLTEFLEDWSRVRSFSGRSAEPLKRAAREIELAATEQVAMPQLSSEVLRDISNRWRHSVQLTTPRASLLQPSDLLGEMAHAMLKQPVHQHRSQTKLSLLRKTRVSLVEALRRMIPEGAEDLVHPRSTVQGLIEQHPIDLAVRNGHLVIAAQAIAFPAKPSPRFNKEIAATAWTVKDVTDAKDSPMLAVILAPPSDRGRVDFARATRVFTDLAADVVLDDGVDEWAEAVVGQLQLS